MISKKTLEQNGFPSGWKWVTLGEVADTTRRKVNPQNFPDLPFIGLENIEAHTMRLLGTIPSVQMRSTAESFAPGDVLYGRLRPYLNKVYCPDFEGICSSEFIPFRKTPVIESKYLQYLLNSWEFVQFASHLNSGDRPRVDFEQLAEYSFLLPPLPAQKAIISKIDELLSQLDSATAALKRVQANLKRYKASVLKAACEGRLVPTEAELARREGRAYESGADLLRRILAERRAKWEAEQRKKGKDPSKLKYEEPKGPETEGLPEGWVWATPDQLASSDDYSLAIGPFGSNLKVSDYRSDGIPLIFVRNIRSGIFDGSDNHFVTEEKARELRPHQVLGGDILITKMGEPPGDAVLYPIRRPKAIITADCVKWTLSAALSNPLFFVHITNSKVIQEQIAEITRGVAQKKISLGRFKSVAYPLPPLNEQMRIAEKIEALIDTIHNQEYVLELNIIRSNRLRQSILKQAFGGRLVPPGGGLAPREAEFRQEGLFPGG